MALNYTIDTSQRLVKITGEYADAVEWKALLTQIVNDIGSKPLPEHPHFVAERHEPHVAGGNLAFAVQGPKGRRRRVEWEGHC